MVSWWASAFRSVHNQHEVLLLLRLLISTRFKLRSGFKPNVVSLNFTFRSIYPCQNRNSCSRYKQSGEFRRLYVPVMGGAYIVYLRAFFTFRAINATHHCIAYVEFSAHHLRRLPTFDKMPALLSKYQLGHQNFMSVIHGQRIVLSVPNIPYQSYISNLSQPHIKV